MSETSNSSKTYKILKVTKTSLKVFLLFIGQTVFWLLPKMIGNSFFRTCWSHMIIYSSRPQYSLFVKVICYEGVDRVLGIIETLPSIHYLRFIRFIMCFKALFYNKSKRSLIFTSSSHSFVFSNTCIRVL